jgi:aminodeoxyfutalosine synthase
VDDLHGTIIEEKIFHMAGARTPQQQTVHALEKAIREAGRPMQRNSYYERISKTLPEPPHLAAAEFKLFRPPAEESARYHISTRSR